MEITAKLRYLHLTPRKVRAVANMVKGMDLVQAERELRHRSKRAAEPLLKLLRSASANAERNVAVSRASAGLMIKEIRVDPGPMTTRFRPRAFGRAAPIRRRTSHISIVLETPVEANIRRPKLGTKEVPLVREATREDLRSETVKKSAVAPPLKTRAPKPRTPGFIRRIFQRKAI